MGGRRRALSWSAALLLGLVGCTAPQRAAAPQAVDAEAKATTAVDAAAAPALASATTTEVAAAPADESVDRPVAAAPIELVIRDLDGRPITGARAIVAGAASLEERTRTSDAGGLVSVPARSPLTVEAPGYAGFRRPRLPAAGPVELTLAPASAIVGRVVDRRGVPIAGALVEAGEGAHPDLRATADADGRFRFDGLWPGRRLLKVRGGGVLGDRMVALGLGETATLDLVASPAATIEARVVLEDGAPCPGGAVTLRVGIEGSAEGCPICGGADPTLDASIAGDGAVRVEVARGLVYGVEVACDGMVRATPDPVIVGDGDVTGLRWVARRGLQARGRVVDGEGRPQAGIELLLRSADDGLIPDEVGDTRAITDAEGRFELRGLVAASYAVELFSESPVDVYFAGEDVLEIGESDLEDQVFTVDGEPWKEREDERVEDDEGDAEGDAVVGAPVQGVVVDAAGAPVAGALVVVSAFDVLPQRALGHLAESWDGSAPVRSDAQGAFTAPRPRQGEGGGDLIDDEDDEGGEDAWPVAIVAYAPGGAVGRALLGRGEAAAEVVVRPLAAVTVRVRDRRGRPITHFGIDLARGRPRPLYVHAPGGSFTIPGLVAGSYRLRIDTPEGDVGRRFEVPARGVVGPLEVVAKGAVDSLSIHVDDLDTGAGLVGCEVARRPMPGRGGPRAPVDAEAYAEFTDVPAGLTRIDVLPCVVGERRYPAQSVFVRLRPADLKILWISVAGYDAKLGRGGRLGYTLGPRRADVDPILQPLRVRAIAPGGPAARAGLRVGDTIIRGGAHEVGGRMAYRHDALTRVAAGARVSLGLADGRSVEIVAE